MFNQIIKWLNEQFSIFNIEPLIAFPIIISLTAIYYLQKHHRNLLEKMPDRKAKGLEVERNKVGSTELVSPETYNNRLSVSLGLLDSKLGSNPWSVTSYDWCFGLAIIYPIVSILLVWGITGEDTSGIPNFLPEVGPTSRFVLLLVLFTLPASLLGFMQALNAKRPLRALVFVFVLVFAFAFAGAVAFAGFVADVGAVAFAGAGAVAFAVAGMSIFLQRKGFMSMSRSIPWLILLLSVFLISYFSSVLDLKNESRSIIVFLGILPLLNVVFDWFSLGVTRFLLRKTNNDNAYYRPYLNGFIDAMAAIIILILLAICITSALQFMNILAYAGGASQPMIDLPGVMKTLRERPGDPAVWWVYIMLFSTLLPSFAHAVIASGHVVTWGLPRSLLERHRKAFKEGFEGDYVKLLKTARTMTLRRVAEFGVAIFGIGIMVFLLWTLHLGLPQLAALLLDISEAIASWQGAILS